MAEGNNGGEPRVQRNNLRTALILFTVAAAFFIGILVKYRFFG